MISSLLLFNRGISPTFLAEPFVARLQRLRIRGLAAGWRRGLSLLDGYEITQLISRQVVHPMAPIHTTEAAPATDKNTTGNR